jgi:hypothetical protein
MRKALVAAATRSKRIWLIASIVVLVVAAGACHSKSTGGELVLTGAADPGANAFMPPAASPPRTDTQPPPTLQPHGDDTTVATLPLPGDRDGLYGGTDNNAGVDRDRMINFLGANPTQAGAFVDALNTDPALYWSGGRRLAVADIPTYLRELTPALLRLDTRITDHGFDGTHPTTLQSVFQAGTAVLVDAHGVPRARPFSGTPLTAPITLTGAPKLVGTPWPEYHPGALAEVQPSTATITNFVLVDVITGHPFNRAAGTTGSNDTPHSQPVPAPGPASATPTTGHTLLDDIDGTYLWHISHWVCSAGTTGGPDVISPVTHQGNTVTIFGDSGPLNPDGSFTVVQAHATIRGVFTNEGGRTVTRATVTSELCTTDYVATKQ